VAGFHVYPGPHIPGVGEGVGDGLAVGFGRGELVHRPSGIG
jgi:hypothetical protein